MNVQNEHQFNIFSAFYLIKINKCIQYTTPDDILNIIGEFASISFQTKKYKRRCDANKMKITKIKYKCHLCKNKYNKNQISSFFTCKFCDQTHRLQDLRTYYHSFAICERFGSNFKYHYLKMRISSRIKQNKNNYSGINPRKVEQRLFHCWVDMGEAEEYRIQYYPRDLDAIDFALIPI